MMGNNPCKDVEPSFSRDSSEEFGLSDIEKPSQESS